jgi:hypothetical protein
MFGKLCDSKSGIVTYMSVIDAMFQYQITLVTVTKVDPQM